jgi:hypothetical protein
MLLILIKALDFEIGLHASSAIRAGDWAKRPLIAKEPYDACVSGLLVVWKSSNLRGPFV